MSIVLTAALTALFGVLVFVAGQLAQKFVLEPIQEQRRVIGEIAYSLVFRGNISNISENRKRGRNLLELEDPIETAKTLRKLAGQLQSTLWTIPQYNMFAKLKIVPSKEAIMTASQNLIGWSNSVHDGDPNIPQKNIAESLKLQTEASIHKELNQ